jgi:LAS superfamily LD-carboxypeptidase LdcB
MRLPWIWVILLLVVNAPQAGARTVTGYKSGQKTRIQLVEVSGVELEAATARAFRTMAKAARKVGIEIGIRSGFRSHEKQKQLYRQSPAIRITRTARRSISTSTTIASTSG